MTEFELLYPLAPPDRNDTIGSTDARRIANGDWRDLYLEKTGQHQPADLRFSWKPRLGLETETLHAWWHAFTTKVQLSERHTGGNQRFTREGLPAHHATSIDRWVFDDIGEQMHTTLEMKHTNERASLRSSAEFYMAQLQWQLYVLNHDSLRFSIIRGNNEPEWGVVDRDDAYINKLIDQVDEFWNCVIEREPPLDLQPAQTVSLAKQGKTIKINGLRGYDMEGDNEWAARASAYVLDKVASEGLKVSEAALKALVPEDAGEIGGAGVSFKRDARGALRVTISDEVKDYATRRLAGLIDMRKESL